MMVRSWRVTCSMAIAMAACAPIKPDEATLAVSRPAATARDAAAQPAAAQPAAEPVAPAIAPPVSPFEAPPPSDPIVALTRPCVVRRSGHVDCWGNDTVERVRDIDDAIAVRVRGGYARCILRRSGVDCDQGSPRWEPPRFPGLIDPIDIVPGNPLCVLERAGRVQCIYDRHGDARPVPGMRDAVAIVAGEHATCVVRRVGQVECVGDARSASRWRKVEGLDHVRLLGLGSSEPNGGYQLQQACAVHDDGALRCYVIVDSGNGPFRAMPQVGHDDQGIPADVAPFHGASALAMTAITLTAIVDGRVVTVEHKRARTLPLIGDAVAITDHCALRRQGSVVCWGDGPLGQPRRDRATQPVPVVGVADVASVATGQTDGWAVTRDGRVHRWGAKRNGWAELFDGVRDAVAVVQDIAIGISRPCFVRRDGGVTCLRGRDSTPVDLRVSQVTALHAQRGGFVALRADGTALRWTTAAIDTPDPLVTAIDGVANAVEVTGDLDQVCFRDRAGDVRCIARSCVHGRCQDEPVGGVEVSAAAEIAVLHGVGCARLTSGKVVCWKLHDRRGTDIPGVDGAIALGTDNDGFCAQPADGSLVCWGQEPPRRVLPAGSLTGHSVGGADGCAIQRDHRVACWGHNTGGRLGDGSVLHLDIPAAVPGL